jgi:hypothetical protein
VAELKTYGDLKKIIKSIALKQKGQQIGNVALDTVIGLIPGANAAKTTFDFIKAAISKPDAKKTNTWLDKLDIDDQMSAIVDDTVENGFMQAMSKSIESESDDKPLESDFNMNSRMVGFLQSKYKGRTIAGIKENKDMDIKEYIKTLVRELLDEESTTAGVPGYLSANAFSPKGQKTNAATKTAKSQGMKLAPTGMPSDSKVRDYKAVWKSAEKPKYKMYENMNIKDIIEQELLNEATYKQFKKEVKHRTKAEQLHKAMREVKRKINEIDRIVDYTQRMKQELSEGDGVKYWGRTEKAVAQISEMVNHLNTKINNLKQ